MEKPIPIPRNQTALMQHMQRLVSAGHYFWTTDCIPKAKLAGLIDKWSGYGLRADAPARAYRKSRGRASVHLCLEPAAANADMECITWWMLSSAGKAGLQDAVTPGQVHDARRQEGRLRVGEYELIEHTKIVPSGQKTKKLTTWTWRLTTPRYKAWEALLIDSAKSIQGRRHLLQSIDCLRAMPMFSGVRAQVLRLLTETNRMLGKLHQPLIEIATLPIMRMVKLWNDEQRC